MISSPSRKSRSPDCSVQSRSNGNHVRRETTIMSWNNGQRPAQCARDLLERLAIHSLPIPVDRVAKTVGAHVVFSPLDDELSGMVFVKGNQIIIGVNSLHHPNRQRFTIS